jgi:hypothetical protein
MPTSQELAQIKAKFSAQYDLDLTGINRDAQALRNYIATLDGGKAASIPAECYTYNGPQDFAPNIETISPSEVTPDTRLQVRQIEANLDEASKYVPACQIVREKYGELARNRSDTRFKGEEFLRLDDVHQQEIDNGLYKLPWEEAQDEAAGLQAAIGQVTEQQAIPDELFGNTDRGNKYSALLADDRVKSNIADNAFIARQTANTLKDQVETRATSTYTVRGYVEKATWLETQAGAKASLAQLGPKLSTAQRKETYLRLDEGFKLQRRNVSRQLAWLQIAEHCRQGSELNFDERLRQYKTLFEASLRPLLERAIMIDKGLREVYGIDLPLDSLEPGTILDRISVWLVKASDAISKWKRTQRLSVIQVATADNFQADAANGTFKAQFSVNSSDLPDSAALLRGVNFEFIGECKIPVVLDVNPPDGAVFGGSEKRLRFGRVCPVAPNLDLRPQQSDMLWNGSPTGVWTVTGTYIPSAGDMTRLLMYLWVFSS